MLEEQQILVHEPAYTKQPNNIYSPNWHCLKGNKTTTFRTKTFVSNFYLCLVVSPVVISSLTCSPLHWKPASSSSCVSYSSPVVSAHMASTSSSGKNVATSPFIFNHVIFSYIPVMIHWGRNVQVSPICMNCLFVYFIRSLRRFQQSFSNIATVSGCGRELNSHF